MSRIASHSYAGVVRALKKHLLSVLKLGLVAGLFYWLIAVKGVIRWEHFAPVVRGDHWGIVICVFLMLIVINAVCASRWYYLLKAQDFGVSYRKAVQFFWIGLLFNFFIPGATGGDVMRIYYVWRENPGRGVEAGSTTIFDRIIGLYGLVIVAFLAALGLYIDKWWHVRSDDAVPQSLFVLSNGVVIVFFSFSAAMAVLISRRIRNFAPWRWLREKLPGAHKIERAYEAVQFYRSRLKVLAITVLMSMFIHIVNIGALVLCARMLGIEASLTTHFLIWALAVLSGALPLTPGGLGVAEAAAAKLWLDYGFSNGASVFLVYRMILLPILLSGLAPFFYYKKPTHEELEDLESALDSQPEEEEPVRPAGEVESAGEGGG